MSDATIPTHYGNRARRVRLTCPCGRDEVTIWPEYRRLIHEALCHDADVTESEVEHQTVTTLGRPYDATHDWRRSIPSTDDIYEGP